jgi:hypothetical protein
MCCGPSMNRWLATESITRGKCCWRSSWPPLPTTRMHRCDCPQLLEKAWRETIASSRCSRLCATGWGRGTGVRLLGQALARQGEVRRIVLTAQAVGRATARRVARRREISHRTGDAQLQESACLTSPADQASSATSTIIRYQTASEERQDRHDPRVSEQADFGRSGDVAAAIDEMVPACAGRSSRRARSWDRHAPPGAAVFPRGRRATPNCRRQKRRSWRLVVSPETTTGIACSWGRSTTGWAGRRKAASCSTRYWQANRGEVS